MNDQKQEEKVMKNMKKFMSLALTASLVAAGFAGCGSKDDTSSSA